jgi:hypothetical protein
MQLNCHKRARFPPKKCKVPLEMSLSAGFKIKGSVITGQPFRDHTYKTQQKPTLITKPTKCTNISNLFFVLGLLHVLDSFSVHHLESSTVHTAICICHTGYADCLLARQREKLSKTCRVLIQ